MSDGLFGSFFGPIFGNNQRTDVTTVKTVHEIVQRDDAEILRLRAENEKLRAERDNFYIEYRMVCDEECKIVHAENEKLRTATTELLSHYYDAMRRDGYADEEVRSEHVFLAAAAALKGASDEQ